MTMQTSIAASQYSILSVSRDTVPASLTETTLKACFATAADFVTIPDIRDLPAIGTPAGTAKVPVYGLSQTMSVGIQSDAPDLDITVNYVGSKWAPQGVAFSGATSRIGDGIRDGVAKVFQLAILSAPVVDASGTNVGGSSAKPVENTLFYWVGKIESIQVQTARDDATTATLSLSVQSDFFGPYTITAV